MCISFDPKKRNATLEERGLDFEDAAEVFAGEIVFEAEDDRRDYAENRIVTVGFLRRSHGRGRLDTTRLRPSDRQHEKGE